jgi:pyruvyl transferase EpsO
LELARSFDCEVRLCPDTALYLGPAQARSPLDANPVYGLFRDDKERVADRLLEATAARVPAADWLSEDEAAMRQRELDWIAQSGKAAGWEQLAQARLERGLDMLSRGRAVVTDRLHAHILSMLLGFPNLVFDNSYGKVWAFIETWTQDSELVTPARSADVVEAWLQLHQGPEAGVSG